MIAGCMGQSKKILAAYDEILYGSSPEKLVESTHKAISDILNTSEALRVFGKSSGEKEISEAERDLLVKRTVEAVAPIIPVTIRNKALDGTYFRTALQCLELPSYCSLNMTHIYAARLTLQAWLA